MNIETIDIKIIDIKTRLFTEKCLSNSDLHYLNFTDVLNTYFKEQCPYLMKMSIKESEYGYEQDGVFFTRNETYGYYGVIEKSDNPEIQEYQDSLFILESVNKIFNDLEIKAKNVYNPFISQLNTMYIREKIHCYVYVDQVSTNRVTVVNGRFGFPKITSNKDFGLYEDGMTLPSK